MRPDQDYDIPSLSGLLAPYPKCFSDCSFRPHSFTGTEFDSGRPPYSMTNKGLMIQPLLGLYLRETTNSHNQIFVMPLNCTPSEAEGESARCVAIFLKRLSVNRYARHDPTKLDIISMEVLYSKREPFQRTLVYIRQGYFIV